MIGGGGPYSSVGIRLRGRDTGTPVHGPGISFFRVVGVVGSVRVVKPSLPVVQS